MGKRRSLKTSEEVRLEKEIKETDAKLTAQLEELQKVSFEEFRKGVMKSFKETQKANRKWFAERVKQHNESFWNK